MSAETALNTSNSPTLPPPDGDREVTPVPAAITQRDARLQAALAASARAEASLNGLFRTIQNLGNGASGAKEANESLTLELEGLRELLGAASDQQSLHEQKFERVESALDRARKEHQRERAFLIEQQDAFLLKLLDEQESELKRRDTELDVLRARLAQLERRQLVTVPPPLVALPSLNAPLQLRESASAADGRAGSELDRAERLELERTAQKLAEDRERARETVARLQGQRDEAQTLVARLSKERDEAFAEINRLKSELGGPRIPLTTRPPPADPRRDSAAVRALSTAATLSLDQLEIEARLDRPRLPTPSTSPDPEAEPSAPGKSKAPPISSVLRPPRSSPQAAPLPTRLSPAPSRLSPVPLGSSPIPPAIQSPASSRPPLKQKPDASTRPLVGYSVGNDGIPSEHVEPLRSSSKPGPGSGKR